jgi:predicted regulator of Ras-like GTPase activity (Roadblock/LC7/MglB family)
MGINGILHEVIEATAGSVFAGVVGTDGIGVAFAVQPTAEDLDLDLAELELSMLTANASAASQRIGSGTVYDMVIETDTLHYLAALITSGYFAVLGVDTTASLGEARLALHHMTERLQNEI